MYTIKDRCIVSNNIIYMHSHSHYICLYIIIYTLYTDVYSTHILQATERIAPCGIHCDIPGFGRSLRVCNSNRKKPWWDHHERGLGKMLSMIIRDYPCWTRWLSITIHYLYYQHVSTIVNNWSTIINNLSTIIRWMIFLSDTIITIIKKSLLGGWDDFPIRYLSPSSPKPGWTSQRIFCRWFTWPTSWACWSETWHWRRGRR